MYIRYSSSAIRHPPCVGVKRNFSYRPVADLSLSHCICCPRHNIPKAFSLNAGALLFWHTHNLNGYIGWCGCHEILISLSSTKESLLPRSKKSQLHRNFSIWLMRETLRDDHEPRIGDTKKLIVLSERVWSMSIHWNCLCFSVWLMLLLLRSVLVAENWRIGVENRQCLCRIPMNNLKNEHRGMRFGRPSVALAFRSVFCSEEVAFPTIYILICNVERASATAHPPSAIRRVSG